MPAAHASLTGSRAGCWEARLGRKGQLAGPLAGSLLTRRFFPESTYVDETFRNLTIDPLALMSTCDFNYYPQKHRFPFLFHLEMIIKNKQIKGLRPSLNLTALRALRGYFSRDQKRRLWSQTDGGEIPAP